MLVYDCFGFGISSVRGVRVRVLGLPELSAFESSTKGLSPQRRKGRKGCAESLNQISAPPSRSLRLCGESQIQS